MTDFKPIAETNNFIVLDKYTGNPPIFHGAQK